MFLEWLHDFHWTVSRFIQIKKKPYAEIILTNEIPPWCDIPSRRVTIMSSRRVITSWRHTFLDANSHRNFNFVGRDMMTGWHIISRRDEILHRSGISSVSNISRKRFYYFYRRGPDCPIDNLAISDIDGSPVWSPNSQKFYLYLFYSFTILSFSHPSLFSSSKLFPP